MENEKKLEEMDNRELFLALTGTYGVLTQARLQNIVRLYLAYSENNHLPDDITLRTIVEQHASGLYGEADK